MDALLIAMDIYGSDMRHILVDNGSFSNLLFASNKMGLSLSHLQAAGTLLRSFSAFAELKAYLANPTMLASPTQPCCYTLQRPQPRRAWSSSKNSTRGKTYATPSVLHSGGSTGGAEGAPAPPNSMKSMGAPPKPPTISSHS